MKGSIVCRASVQIAVAQLTIAVVVVEVMRNVDGCRGGVTTYNYGLPTVVEVDDIATAFALRLREPNFRATHRYAGGNSDASLLVVVDSTIKMVNHPIVLHYIRLVSKHLVIRLRRDNEVFTIPCLPVDEVARDSKCIEGIIFATGVVGLEVEHHIEIIHLSNLSVASNDTAYFVGKNGVAVVAFPFFEVIG